MVAKFEGITFEEAEHVLQVEYKMLLFDVGFAKTIGKDIIDN